jgi:hypothetical protein
MFSTGVQVDKGLFARDIVGTTVGDFVHTILLLSDRQWDKIKTLSGTLGIEERPSRVHVAHFNHRSLYEASSE